MSNAKEHLEKAIQINPEYADAHYELALLLSTNSEYEKVGWLSNKMINLKHYGFDNWTNLVNMDSYTNESGEAFTVLGVWEEFISEFNQILNAPSAFPTTTLSLPSYVHFDAGDIVLFDAGL